MFAGASFPNVRVAMAMMPVTILPFMLFAGFYSNRGTYADWIGWIEYASPFKYGFYALVLNEYKNTNFKPDPIK